MLRAVIPSRSSYYPYSSPFLRFSSSELSISSAHCRYRASSSPVAQHAFPHGRLSAATEFVFFVVTACMLLSGSSTAPGPLAIIGEHLTPSRPVTHVVLFSFKSTAQAADIQKVRSFSPC